MKTIRQTLILLTFALFFAANVTAAPLDERQRTVETVVADALAGTGFTAMVGDAVAGVLGSSVSPFVFIFIFALLTSTCATFTGSNMGSVYIFAPIAIAACTSLGLNPTAAAIAVVISGWNGGYMPIDGMPAMILGMGKYKLPEFWLFSVPMYLIRILALCVGAIVIFPM